MINIFIKYLKSFFKNENSYIVVTSNMIYLYYYSEIVSIKDTNIIIKINQQKLNISGIDLKITMLMNQELEIQGIFNSIEVIYE